LQKRKAKTGCNAGRMAEEVLDGINAAFEEVVAKEWRKVWQVAGLERRALRVASLTRISQCAIYCDLREAGWDGVGLESRFGQYALIQLALHARFVDVAASHPSASRRSKRGARCA